MTLKDYCKEKQISYADFSKITGISAAHIYIIHSDPDYNMTRENMRKIYEGTKKRFGVGLLPHQYLNISGESATDGEH